MAVQIVLDTVDAQAFAGLDRLAKKLDDLDAKVKNLGQSFAAPKLTAVAGGQGYSSRGRAADGMVGPFRRAARAQEELNKAIASGDALRLGDALFNADKAEAALARATKPKSSAFMNAVASTRFGQGADGKVAMFPLIGRTAAALGSAGTIATAGIGAAYSSMNSSGESVRNFTNSYYRGGGGPNTGKGLAIGGFAGTDAASDAVSLGDKLRSGGIGASYLRGKGVIDLGFKTVDKMSNLTKAIEELAKIQDENTRIMVARDVGLEGYLRFTDASPNAQERLKNSFGQRSKADMKINAEFDTFWETAKNRFGNAQDAMWTGIKKPFADMSAGNFGTAILGTMINGIVGPVIGGFINRALPFSNDDGSGGKKSGTKEVVDAVKDMHRTMKEGRDGVGSMSGRALGAIPASWRMQMADEAIRLQSMHLGSY